MIAVLIVTVEPYSARDVTALPTSCETVPMSLDLSPRREFGSGNESRVWGHWCRILVLQAQQSCDFFCIGTRTVLEHVWSRDVTQAQSRPFPRVCVVQVGSAGNETTA